MIVDRRYSSSIYNIDCIKAAIYKFSKMVYVKIDIIDGDFVCNFSSLSDSFDFDEFLKNFDQELIDQELRQSISNKTEEYRNFILSLAFSKTGLQGDE